MAVTSPVVQCPVVDKDTCGVCDCQDFHVIGQWRHGEDARIAEVPVSLEDNQYEIRQCRSCGFRWKSPQISYHDCRKYYAASTTTDWFMSESAVKSRRLEQKQQLIEHLVSGHRVLDIGCWQGGFLSCWGARWERFGIEPNDAGRKACCEAGIKLIGHAVEDISHADLSFDAVCMMDVLEHLPDPFHLLKPVAERLEPAGALMIETGDTDSLHARVMGSDWYYYGCAEHVSFCCAHALHTLFARLGLAVRGIWRWPHMVRGRRHVAEQWYAALTYKWPVLRPRHLARCLVRQRRLPKRVGVSPWLTGLSDHILIIGLKPDGRM